jgi:hypothetical protein
MVAAMLSMGAATASGADEPGSGVPGIQAFGDGSQWDAHVRKDKPWSNFGRYSTVDSLADPERRGYLMFDVKGIVGPVQKATLSLQFMDGVGVPVVLRRVADTSWNELGITWNNAPPAGDVLATFTPGADGKVTIDVTPAVSGNGRVSFAFSSTGDYAKAWSREAGQSKAPKLTVTAGAPPPPPPPAPPVNTGLPALSGTAQVGKTLSTTNGSWSGATPMTFAYQWRRCDAAGSSCVSIPGATSSSYALASADLGRTIRAQVTATNAAGSASASSAQSAVVQPVPPPPPPPPPPGGGSSRFGIAGQTSVLTYEPDADFAKDMGMIESSGAGWLRIDINWDLIQRKGPGTYDWAPFDRVIQNARGRGLNVLGTITNTPSWARPSPGDHWATPPKNMADYRNFAQVAAARYAAMGVHAFEIWNEPNITPFFKPAPNPAKYVELLKAGYQGVRAGDPSATVISGGLSPAATEGGNIDPRTFVQAMYGYGAKGYFDALGHHPYCFPAAPGDAQNWSAWYQMYGPSNSLRATMTANGDGAKRIWATEWGVPTNGPSGTYVTEAVQAQQLTKAYALFKTYSWAGPLFTYVARDKGTDPSSRYNFYGLSRFNFTLKPAYAAYQTAAAAG